MFWSNHAVKTLPMRTVARLLQKDDSIRLLDVRTESEYKGGHLPNSLNLPLDRLFQIGAAVPDKAARLFVYCQSGVRSDAACRQLAILGYTDVTNIGGIAQWPGDIEVSVRAARA